MSNPLLGAKLLRESGHGMVTVKGGPFQGPHTMEWQVVNGNDQAVGVVNEKAAQTINQLVELRRILVAVDAIEHLRQRFDSGQLEIPVESFRALEQLLAP